MQSAPVGKVKIYFSILLLSVVVMFVLQNMAIVELTLPMDRIATPIAHGVFGVADRWCAWMVMAWSDTTPLGLG
ncbi:MAG: hypothetical protein OEU36_19600 [Gammaproteobacteria bacterium]|nr:hypothetical protein [Gammaproteobacteria bacterium]